MSLKKLLTEAEQYMPKMRNYPTSMAQAQQRVDGMNKIKSKVKSKVIGVTSDVLSAPKRLKSGLSRRESKIDFLRLRNARQYKGMPDFNADGTVSDGFKARRLAEDAKERTIKRTAKLLKDK